METVTNQNLLIQELFLLSFLLLDRLEPLMVSLFLWIAPSNFYIFSLIMAVPQLWKRVPDFQVRSRNFPCPPVPMISSYLIYLYIYWPNNVHRSLMPCRSSLKDGVQFCPFCAQPISGTAHPGSVALPIL